MTILQLVQRGRLSLSAKLSRDDRSSRAPDEMLADGPFFAPTQLLHQDERPGQFPSATERFSLATIRRGLAHPSGRLIAQGRQSWQSRTPQFVSPLIHDIGTGDIEVNAVETATWKYALVRTSGHF